MPFSDTARAERISRNCAILMTLGALVLIGSCALSLADDRIGLSPGRAAFWGLSMLLWMIVLATGGGLLLSRRIREILNDELTLQNRARAIQTGFWVAMAAVLGIYAASFTETVTLRQALNLIATAGISAALLRFAWLQRG